jgi:hypothetical protein
VSDDEQLGAYARMKRAMKPTGRTFSGVSDTGDGDRCPVEGHGKMYVYGEKQWCPHSDHSAKKGKEHSTDE